MVAIYILFSSKSFHNSSTTSFASPDEPSSISETDALYLHPADGIGDTETALIIKQQTKYVLIKFSDMAAHQLSHTFMSLFHQYLAFSRR
jgi:hypothetical protein